VGRVKAPTGRQRGATRLESVRDGLGAAAFAAVSLIPALQPYGVVLGELPVRDADAVHTVLVLAQTLPLALRRRAPASVLAVVGVAFGLDQSFGYPASPAGLGVLFALYSAAVHQRHGRALSIGLGVVAYAALAVALVRLGSHEDAWGFITFFPVLAAAWGIGELVRLGASAARTRAQVAARTAVADERARLAAELHDVVSHHVTGMVVQADAAAFLLPPDEVRVREQLASIGDHGRRALVDLRQLLDVLGTETAPTTPAVRALAELVAEARGAGQSAELDESGKPSAVDEVRLAVYRIAQEGLTNARKHAPGARTDLRVSWGGREVRIVVATAPPPPGAVAALPGSGHGLNGLAERVRRLGGAFEAGPDERGWFVLSADIPDEHEDA
jgi:signal transduction histidine kinase